MFSILSALAIGLISANPYYQDPVFEKTVHAARHFGPRKQHNDSEALFVHLIAHTHDDVGWLKTVDEYYSGSYEREYQQAEVNLIISEAVEALTRNPQRKFTYVEIKFFSMWYDRATQDEKDQVTQLIKEGRWEFVNAGWSMHDEAAPHYEDMINNMMYGQMWLNETFGVVPRIGWHVDPFGHSSANPRIFADLGFDAWMFARLSWDDKDRRLRDQAMNTLWRPFSAEFGNQKQIFTAIMQDHYCWAQGYWYDEREDLNNDNPFISDPSLKTFNADQKTKDLADYILGMAENYRGNQLMIPMGCDFTYANARQGFENMERLIEYFNANNEHNITLGYSTPGQYLDSLYEQNLTWPVNYDDMFPYADNPEDFWTGYFASRQWAKIQVREGQQNLHSSGQLLSEALLLEGQTPDMIESILAAKDDVLDAMGVYQHHDGISGTAKQHVADDYMRTLDNAMITNTRVYQAEIKRQIERDAGIVVADDLATCRWSFNDTTYQSCPINQAAAQTANSTIVAIHNPRVQDSNELVSFLVPPAWRNAAVYVFNQSLNDTDPQKFVGFQEVESQTVFADTIKQTDVMEQIEQYEIYAQVSIPAMSIAYVKLNRSETAKEWITDQPEKISLTNASNCWYGECAGGVSKIAPWNLNFTYTDLLDWRGSQNFSVNLGMYYASNGSDNYQDSDNSPEGAYLFKPARALEYQMSYIEDEYQQVATIDGSLVKGYVYLLQNLKDRETQGNRTAMVYVKYFPRFSKTVEVEIQLNGIPIKDGIGKDVMANFFFNQDQVNSEHFPEDFPSAFCSDNGTFYTDSNALEMQKRQLNFRPTWNYTNITQPVSGNYYPVNSALAIYCYEKGWPQQATVMTERSTAGSAHLYTGRIELIHNRRLLFDDNRGVGEALNETDIYGNGIKVSTKYYVDFAEAADPSNGQDPIGLFSEQRPMQIKIDQPLQYFWSFNYTVDESKAFHHNVPTNISFFPDGYPDQLLATMKVVVMPLDKVGVTTKLLVRFENIFDLADGFLAPMNVSMVSVVTHLYERANPHWDGQMPNWSMVEVALGNNQGVDAAASRHRDWKGEDDEAIAEMLAANPALKPIYETPRENYGDTLISVAPMEIRQFQITISPPGTTVEELATFLQ